MSIAVHHSDSTQSTDDDPLGRLARTIEHASHLLPAQGPITVFVHHNTLHAFEDQSFDAGVQDGAGVFGCRPYLSEQRYHDEFRSGRIRLVDLEAVLAEDLGDRADALVATFGTRYALRLAMMQHALPTGSDAELDWVVTESEALRRFDDAVPADVRKMMTAGTRRWVLQTRQDGSTLPHVAQAGLGEVLQQFGVRSINSWSDATWEAFVLNWLWKVCFDRVSCDEPRREDAPRFVRHRDAILEATGVDTDELVHDVLIRFCAAFLDQGFAHWTLPNRDNGLFESFVELFRKSRRGPAFWSHELPQELQRIADSGTTPLQSIAESLEQLGVATDDDEFLSRTLLALRGWAGMIQQMETNADWAPRPAPEGSLIGFLAVRLLLDRLAVRHVATDVLGFKGPLCEVLQAATDKVRPRPVDYPRRRAFTIFQLARSLGWQPQQILELSAPQWRRLLDEIEAFSEWERRRIFHHAYERKYRHETFNAVAVHSRRRRENSGTSTAARERASFQVVCCIDDREESFRRHLEEIAPDCETFGVAGFFGVAMYYRGIAEAHFRPLCPVNIKPRHYVVEEPLYSLLMSSRRRAEARRRFGQFSHQAHVGTRTFVGGLLTGLLGSIAAFPLVARVLFPRTTAQLRRSFSHIVQPRSTQLRLERIDPEPGLNARQFGYSLAEMAAIVEGGLRAIGLGHGEMFAPLVVICGHGSVSVNNPHRAAYDCGACGGGHGGPNARAFAQMANDPRVRRLLEGRGLMIPDDVVFVGGFHNTCDDSLGWFDLDRLPISHRELFERCKDALDEARKDSARERCRRFESASLTLSAADALRHVEGRSEDLSQARPECGHATNALCFVGRREWSRGLFLDRRAFLTSYDPEQDDERRSILEKLLQAVIPVCAGINLEYYFSYVDPVGYGCGTKLPHNVTSLLGVMDGAASDLRPGLPWQMVEIHEPVRLLFVIETTAKAMRRIVQDNPAIARLVEGHWVQLAIFDAQTSTLKSYRHGEFEDFAPEADCIPQAESSRNWYQGRREHLGFASIRDAQGQGQ